MSENQNRALVFAGVVTIALGVIAYQAGLASIAGVLIGFAVYEGIKRFRSHTEKVEFEREFSKNNPSHNQGVD